MNCPLVRSVPELDSLHHQAFYCEVVSIDIFKTCDYFSISPNLPCLRFYHLFHEHHQSRNFIITFPAPTKSISLTITSTPESYFIFSDSSSPAQHSSSRPPPPPTSPGPHSGHQASYLVWRGPGPREKAERNFGVEGCCELTFDQIANLNSTFQPLFHFI